MKCPECGFECLPDDLECLACGIDIASAVKNKEKERIRSLEAAERKAKYDIELKKELGLIPADDAPTESTGNGLSLEETFKKAPLCPKCGLERHPDVPECLRCGVIFEKLEPFQNGKRDLAKDQSGLPSGSNGNAHVQTVKMPSNREIEPIQTNPVKPPTVAVASISDHIRPEEKTTEINLDQLKPVVADGAGAQDTAEDLNDLESPVPDQEAPTIQMPTESPLQTIDCELSGTADDADDDLQNLTMEGEPPSVEKQNYQAPPDEVLPIQESFQVPPIVETSGQVVLQAQPTVMPSDQTIRQEPMSLGESDEKTEIIPRTTRVRTEPRIPVAKASRVTVYRQKARALYEKAYGFLGPVFSKGRDSVIRFVGSKEKNAKMMVAMAVILVVAISTPLGISYYKNAKIERLKQEHAENLEKIRVDFMTNKDEISRKITLIISNKLFDSAEKEIALYDIPSLQAELVPLKNYLKEIRLYEKAKMIPAVEFEQNYQIFTELLQFNPTSQLYQSKRDFYKLKLANNEASIAEAFLTSKNKTLADLNKAMAAIEKALELFPDSKNYVILKKKLLTENLLFYEGNDNIVMAVQDNGMGKKLYSGQRKMTVWVKNISQETVYINVQFFTMIGQDQKRYTYNDIGRRFKTKLLPGEQTRGELYFRTRTRPAKIVFSHLISGEISRTFP